MKMTLVTTLALGWLWSSVASAQTVCTPRIQWQQAFGGTRQNVLYSLQQTSDNGYILAGYSDSPASGNKTGTNYGMADVWLVRLDAGGNKLWEKTYGGTNHDVALTVQQTPDGGFIAGAWSESGVSGNKTTPSLGGVDAWLLRLNADGNVIWQKSYGGMGNDAAVELRVTQDGGFVFAGSRTAALTNTAYPDGWVVRLDSDGEILWSATSGGGDYDYFTSIQETSGGGFIAGGSQLGSRVQDFWVVRFSAGGETVWEKTYGSQGGDALAALAQTSDGGFLLAGHSDSSFGPPEGDKTHPGFGSYDYWLVKIDGAGNKIWDQVFGGNGQDVLQDLQLTADGGALLGGYSYSSSFGNKTAPAFGQNDFWIVRIDSGGSNIWDASYGASGDDVLYALDATADGGFVLGGYSTAGIGGNKAALSFGIEDFWVVKLAPESDCDSDGVPNERDACPDTPAGVPVNSSGCGIDQLCPCDGGWARRSEYASCVKRAAAAFADGGLITREQEHDLAHQAQRAACPPGSLADAVYVFGLPHVPIGGAILSSNPEDGASTQLPPAPEGPVYVSNLPEDGRNGVSILLGEADAGLFVAPSVSDVEDGYFMLGKAYGKVNSKDDQLISTIRGGHQGYATFPVEVDFSPIGVTHLTLQVFDGDVLVAEVEQAAGSVAIFSETTPGQRANPFWRRPDGTIGAVIELGGSRQIHYPPVSDFTSQSKAAPPTFPLYGDRIFIRANDPGRRVDYVSRMDVFGGGGLPSFWLYDERLGMFGRPHKALGAAILEALNGRLMIRNSTEISDDGAAVIIETRHAARIDVDLVTLELINEGASLQMSSVPESSLNFFQADIINHNGVLQMGADFSGFVGANEPLLLKVYRNGSLVGFAEAPNGTAANGAVAASVRAKTSGQLPGLIGCGVASDNEVTPFFALTFRHDVIFTATNGAQLQGNHVRIQPARSGEDRLLWPHLTLGVANVHSFTITGERTTLTQPKMDVVRAGDKLRLSWPHLNQPFAVEAGAALAGPFTTVTNDQEFIEERGVLTLPIEQTSGRFFRLRLSEE